MSLKLPLYVYRRKGQPSFVVCDKARFDDLSRHPHLFETQVIGGDIPDNKELLRLLALAWGTGDVSAEDCRKIDALIAGQDAQPCRPELTVWYGPMPESNGKSNFTAMLMRKGGSTLDSMTHGICLERSEYPDRVRYEADRARHLIGELENEPCILDYDPEKHSGYKEPEEEKGSGSLEFDGLLAAFHAIVWATAESDDPTMAYDEAGNKEAKQLQAMYRAAVEGRKA